MKQNQKMEYNAPQIERIEARVEKGFEMSSTDNQMTGRGNETLDDSGIEYTNSQLFS